MKTTAINVSDSDKTSFEEQGYLIFENALQDEDLEGLRQACADAMARMDAEMDALGTDTLRISHRGKRYFAPYESQQSAAVREFIESDAMLDMAQALIGPNVVRFLDQYVVKCAEVGMKFGWHQDSGYLPYEHKPYLTCWIPLDDCTIENGTIYVLPYDRAGTRDKVEHRREEGTRDMVGYFGDDPGEPVIVPAGAVVVFSSMTFHRSGTNTTDKMRRVLLVQYSPDPLKNPETGEVTGMDTYLVKDGKKINGAIENEKPFVPWD